MAKEKDILQDTYSEFWTPVTKVAAGTGLAAGGAYAARGTVRSLMEGVLDTQGYGVNSPIDKYKSEGKISQALNNALQAGKRIRGKRGVLSAGYEFMHSTVTGQPLELKAMRKSMQDVERRMSMVQSALQDPSIKPVSKKMLQQELTDLTDEIINRQKGLKKRTALTTNVKMSLGRNVSNINLGEDFKIGTYTVDDKILKIDPGMKGYAGKTLPSLIHTGDQVKDFKGYAARDPRVRYFKELMRKGKLKEASVAAYESHMKTKSGKIYIPEIGADTITKQNPEGLPVNHKGSVIGRQKFTELPKEEWAKFGGKKRKTFRLGFAPIIPQGLTKKMEYVTGQHWQYMDFVHVGKGKYAPIGGGMRDIHDLGTGRFKKFAERRILGARPVINTADWILGIRSPVGTKYKTTSKIRYGSIPPASGISVYGSKEGANIAASRPGTKLSKLAKLAAKIARRGR
jgi:hypothetical protein